MGWPRTIVLALLALWGGLLGAGLVAHLLRSVCSASHLQALFLAIGVLCLALPFSAWRRGKGLSIRAVTLLLGVAGAGFCSLLGLLPSETVFVFDPAIDTVTSTGFSRQAFARLESGMTEAQVLDLLGEPLGRQRWSAPPCHADFDQTWSYSHDGGCGWCDAAWRSYTVSFLDGKLSEAREQWYCD